MTTKYFHQMLDLSQEDITSIEPQDGLLETIECSFCDGEGCKECNYTGMEYPEDF